MATTRSFGIITSTAGLQAGICVNSIDATESAEIAEARDEKGKVTDLAAFSKGTSVTISGVLDSAKGELVTGGAKITVGGKDYIVESVQKNEVNNTFVNVTVQAKTADTATITEYTA